jgi:hypothetical protein
MLTKVIPFEKSFASHLKSAFWSDKNINGPDEFTLGSNYLAYFNCACGKEFTCRICDIARDMSGCPLLWKKQIMS